MDIISASFVSLALAEAIKTNKIKKIDKTTNDCFLYFIFILHNTIKILRRILT